MQEDLHDIENVFNIIVGLDAVGIPYKSIKLLHEISCFIHVLPLMLFCTKIV